MNFGVKSLVTKLFVSFFVFAVLLSGVLALLWYQGFLEQFPVWYVLWGVTGIILAYMAIFILVFIVRPLRKVLSQMQLVLTGKPSKKIYTTRVDEIGLLAHFYNQVNEGFSQVASDIKDRRRILDELAVAVELQQQLFPKAAPEVSGLKIDIKNRPATELGGDSFDAIDGEKKTYIYVGDVTGHGVTAGLIMAMVNSMVRSFIDVSSTALEVIINTNKYIKKYTKPSMYMTMVMLCWDKASSKMSYIGAGHERILVYRAEKEQVEESVSGGTALGLVEDVSGSAKEQDIPLAKGDKVVLYSDGITEAKNSKDELFGLERLKKAVVEYSKEYSAAGVNNHIARDLAQFVGNESQLDDMTLIVIDKT